MEEVQWTNLENGKEYYIENILPAAVNEFGTPLGRKKKGLFIGIETIDGVNYAKFKNLIEVPRETYGPYLPSRLGTITENIFSVNVFRFYKSAHEKIVLKQLEKKFGDMTNTNFGETVISKNQYLGGKKARRNKKSKRTKKGKTSKKRNIKSRKNKKRH